MTGKELQQKIGMLELKLSMLKQERTERVQRRYQELYNINTWNKTKAGHVYEILSKEFLISVPLVKKIVLTIVYCRPKI